MFHVPQWTSGPLCEPGNHKYDVGGEILHSPLCYAESQLLTATVGTLAEAAAAALWQSAVQWVTGSSLWH